MANMPHRTFIQHMQKAGFITIMKYLDVPLNTAKRYNQSGELREYLEKRYAELSPDELGVFEEAFLLETGTKRPVWAKFRHDFFDAAEDNNGFQTAYIDAYTTGHPDEPGQLIAQVIGALIDRKPATYVSYRTADALTDDAAQAYIAQVVAEVEQELTTHQAEKDKRVAISSDSSH